MRPPPLILGAALLFWGWQCGQLWAGASMAILLEFSHLVRGRWDFSDKELNRLWDLCTIFFIATAMYLRFSEDITSGAYKFFQWMPLIFFPMAAGFIYSTRDGVPLKAFSWLMRRKHAQGGDRLIAFGWAYLALVAVTAGAGNSRDAWFYGGFATLTGWALWSLQPGRIPAPAWCAMFAALALGGYIGQTRLEGLQNVIETKMSELFIRFGRREENPGQSRTAMGEVGALKQSGAIVMKVTVETGLAPERLRESTFARLEGTTWRGSARSFESLPLEPDATTWTLITNAQAFSTVRIIERVDRRGALITAPLGTAQLTELASQAVQTNVYAAIRAQGNPGLVNYVAHHGEISSDIFPREFDLAIPEDEKTAIAQAAREVELANPGLNTPLKITAALERYFSDRFRYTTYLTAKGMGLYAGTPLAEFLLKTRAGHCEYFATATVLMLRHFKIPARYATGYALDPASIDRTGAYIVRKRHGHAWALWHDGRRWLELDTTPADWARAEAAEFSPYQKFKDSLQQLTFGFLEWRWLGDWSVFRAMAPWLAGPLALALAWRIFGRRMSRRERRPREAREWPGADSEFFALQRALARNGMDRQNEETTETWIERILPETPELAGPLRDAAWLHDKYRFDPEGLRPDEREELRRLAAACARIRPAAGKPAFGAGNSPLIRR